MRNSLILSVAAAAALVLAGCAETEPIDTAEAVGSTTVTTTTTTTEPVGTFVPANEFVAVAQTRRPVVVHGDMQGYWSYDTGNTLYFVSGGTPRYQSSWTIRDDLYCMDYDGRPDRCYQVYRTGPNRYALYTTDNELWARISF